MNSKHIPSKAAVVKEWLLENDDRYPTRSALVKACVKRTSVHQATVYRRLLDLEATGVELQNRAKVKLVKSTSKKKSKSKLKRRIDKALSLDDIKEEIDIPSQIRSVMDDVDDKVLKDKDLRVGLGVDKDKWEKVLEMPSLSQFHMLLEGRKSYVVWGNPDTLDKLKNQLELT